MDATTLIQAEVERLAGYLVPLLVVGVGIAVVIYGLRFGFFLVLSFIDSREASRWRKNFDRADSDRDDYGSEW